MTYASAINYLRDQQNRSEHYASNGFTDVRPMTKAQLAKALQNGDMVCEMRGHASASTNWRTVPVAHYWVKG